MYLVILILLFISFLIWSLFSSKIKGVIGEKTISLILSQLDKSKFKVLNNILLKSNGHTSQIDHVVISDYGVFVLETKNYKGWIFGNENSEYWTQVIYNNKVRFYNPIKQNLGHISALKKCLLEFPNIEYKSIIVFTVNADIKTTTNTDVIYSNQLISRIKEHSSINLAEIDKKNIMLRIQASNLNRKYDKKQHINSIRQKTEKRQNSINQNICPHCGNDLIMRHGKFGWFLGCKTYPKCNFSQTVK